MYLSGVVIPDEYDDDEDVVVADSPGEQIYKFQQYGDDGILDGAEGFGALQAKALKRKLTRGRGGRRRLGVGRRAFVMVGASPLYDGFGIAPLAVAGGAVTAVKKLGGVFKKPSPRMFGGPLVTTVNGVRDKLEGRVPGAAAAIATMNNDRLYNRNKTHKSAWSRIWNEVMPTWQLTPEAYAHVIKLDPAFRGMRPAPTATLPPGTPIYTPTTGGSQGPVPGPVVDATGAPAPSLPYVPPPIPATSGGGATATEQVAQASEEGGAVETVQAGMGIDPKMFLIGGAIALLVLGGRGRRR